MKETWPETVKRIYPWTAKEKARIRRNLKGLCADVDNEPEAYEVSVKYNHRDVEYCICPDPDYPNILWYTKTKLYRNSNGDITDEKILLQEKHSRILLPEIVRVMIKEVRRS